MEIRLVFTPRAQHVVGRGDWIALPPLPVGAYPRAGEFVALMLQDSEPPQREEFVCTAVLWDLAQSGREPVLLVTLDLVR